MLGGGSVKVSYFQWKLMASHHRSEKLYIDLHLSWKKILVGNLCSSYVDIFGSMMVVRMRKLGVMIPFKLPIGHISFGHRETLFSDMLLRIMGKLVGFCRLGDSSYGLQHSHVCWDSSIV